MKYESDIKNTWKTISEIICKSNTKKNPEKLLIDGTYILNKQEIVNKFNEYFVGIGPKLANNIPNINNKSYADFLRPQIDSVFHFELLTDDDVTKLINSLRSKSSYGYDGISTKFLKEIAPPLISPLRLVINQSLITGIFPKKLKIAKVCPFFKKGDDKLLDNYRPISLLTAISKLFEKAAFNQFYSYLCQKKLLHKNQYGFQKLHSTEHAALELIDHAINEIEKKSCAATIFLDLSKAFDTIDHDILLKKLQYYGLSNTELKWFHSYLTGRQQYVEIGDTKSDLLNVTTGVPQGSILGPLLFIIYINDLPKCSKVFRFILYADDTSLFSTLSISDPGSNASNILNRELNNVYEWLSINKLSLNVSKTKYILFHAKNKRLTDIIPQLFINGIPIERVTSFDFLGLVIHENLIWKNHADKVANKISKYMGILCRLKRYLPVNILKIIYCSMIQSHLNYCILAWGYENQRIAKLQKKIIRIISNSKYNAHTEPIFKSLELLNINDIFRVSCLDFYYKHCNNTLPHYLQSISFRTHADTHSYSTRNRYRFVPNVTRTVLAEKCIRNEIVKVINSTEDSIIQKIFTHSLQGYKKYIKLKILQKYQSECNLLNCYICNRS